MSAGRSQSVQELANNSGIDERNPIYVVLIAVLVLVILSGGTAGLLVALCAGRRQTQKSVIEKLIHIALLGAGAVIAQLGRLQAP